MGMNIIKQLNDGFVALRQRDRVIAVAAVAALLVLGGNLLLLKPQAQAINALKSKDGVLAAELAETKRALVSITSLEEKGIDPLADDKAILAALEADVAKVGSLMGAVESSASQVGILVRGLIKSSPGLTLVSLKTRPGALFYTPPQPPAPKKEPQTGVQQVLASVIKEKEKPVAPVVLVQKPLYKHGVDVSIKGAYPALMVYLEEMQKFPQRIFWSEAVLDAGNYREATLKLVVYTLSDQPTPPLN